MMRTRVLIFLCITFIPFVASAQGESNNWYFGFGAGLQFENNGTVEVVYDGQTRASEGVSSISDPNGQLLFYTDGGTVYNREHNVMANGNNLYGTEASTQSSVIVPLPQNPDIYYVFTIDATSPTAVRGRGLNYSIIDMSQDGSNGAVIEKNTNLLVDCTEKIAVVIGDDCRDETLWVVAISSPTGTSNSPVPPLLNFNSYHAFKMDASGVSPTSVVSTFPINATWDGGYLKASLDGTKLANAQTRSGLYLSDFNNITGEVSNLQTLDITSTAFQIPYGVEFSPNSQFLYVHAFKQRTGIIEYDSSLIQFDVSAPDVVASQVVIEERELFRGALQMGPDGKIYRALSINFFNDYDGVSPIENGVSYLGVINEPNEKGTACNYEHNAVEIQGNRVRQGLPPLVQSFFSETRLARIEDIVVDDALAACIGDSLLLEAQNIPGATYFWEKDGIPLPDNQNNLVAIASAGTADVGDYTVAISRPNAENCPVTGEISVEVYEKPDVGDFSINVCDAGDGNAADGITETNLLQYFANTGLEYLFYATQSDLESDNPLANPSAYTNTTPFTEILYYRAINVAGCDDSGELTLAVRGVPNLDIEETYLVCTDQASTPIEGPEGYDTYSWFRLDGGVEELVSTENIFNVTMQGNYKIEANIVTVTNGVETICPTSAEFEVLPSNAAVISAITVDRFTDTDTDVEIIVTGDGDYEYSSNGTTFQEANILENVNAGTVTFSVRDKNGCGVVTETLEILPDISSGFPNFFTPNNDGTNDTWQILPPVEDEELDVVEIRIFSRYGQLLLQMSPDTPGWDGMFNGKPMPESDYWFSGVKKDGNIVEGHFTLKR